MSDLNAEIAAVDAALDYAEDFYGSDAEIEKLRAQRWELIDRESKERAFANAPMGVRKTATRVNPSGDPLEDARRAVASARGRLDSLPVSSPEREAASKQWHAARDAVAEIEARSPFSQLDDGEVKAVYADSQIEIENLREALAKIDPKSRHKLQAAKNELAAAEKHLQLAVTEDQTRGHRREQQDTLDRIHASSAHKQRRADLEELEARAEVERKAIDEPVILPNGVHSYRSPEKLNALLAAIEEARAKLTAPLTQQEIDAQARYWRARGEEVLERAGSKELAEAQRESRRQQSMFQRGFPR